MKIRMGFVSNSSSSSFIVSLTEKPESAKDIMKLFFPNKLEDDVFTIKDNEFWFNDIKSFKYNDIINFLFDNMQLLDKNDKGIEKIFDLLIDDYPFDNAVIDMELKERDVYYFKYFKNIILPYLIDFMKNSQYIAVFDISDDTLLGACIETVSEIWQNVDYKCINMH